MKVTLAEPVLVVKTCSPLQPMPGGDGGGGGGEVATTGADKTEGNTIDSSSPSDAMARQLDIAAGKEVIA